MRLEDTVVGACFCCVLPCGCGEKESGLVWPGDDSVPSVSQLRVPQCPPYIHQGPKEQPRTVVSVTVSEPCFPYLREEDAGRTCPEWGCYGDEVTKGGAL